MKFKNGLAVLTGLIIIALLIGSAILLESAYLLYAATAIPILMVPFIPDIRTKQTVNAGKPSAPIRLFRTSAQPGEGFLIIETDPGALDWSQPRLYINTDRLPLLPQGLQHTQAASMTILQYDLVQHPRKKNLFAIELQNVIDRLQNQSYTTEEITRLVIRMEDLKLQGAAGTVTRTAPARKGLEA